MKKKDKLKFGVIILMAIGNIFLSYRDYWYSLVCVWSYTFGIVVIFWIVLNSDMKWSKDFRSPTIKRKGE